MIFWISLILNEISNEISNKISNEISNKTSKSFLSDSHTEEKIKSEKLFL
jgi:hypothetical protein